MKTIERIRAAAEEARRQGLRPRKVFLTVDDGRKLQFEMSQQDAKVAHRIEHDGVRRALHRVEGLEVVWRSPEFKVS